MKMESARYVGKDIDLMSIHKVWTMFWVQGIVLVASYKKH